MYGRRRRTPKTEEEEREEKYPRITKESLLRHCREHKLYSTPYLNDVLYLHYKGYSKIENLEEYTGLKCLWLENNGINKIENLENQKELKNLYLHHNLIKDIENLEEACPLLDSLNLCHNNVTKIQNLSRLTFLHTLNISHNRLQNVADLEHLRECTELSCLDISHNWIEDPAVIDIFEAMQSLRVLYLTGNPVIKKIPSYRKNITVRCRLLTYLDDRPIFPKDRAAAEAWSEGGLEAERACRQKWADEERAKITASVKGLLALRDRAREIKAMREQNGENKPTDEPENVIEELKVTEDESNNNNNESSSEDEEDENGAEEEEIGDSEEIRDTSEVLFPWNIHSQNSSVSKKNALGEGGRSLIVELPDKESIENPPSRPSRRNSLNDPEVKAKLHEALLSTDWIHESPGPEESTSRRIIIEESNSKKDLIEEVKVTNEASKEKIASTSKSTENKILIEEISSSNVPLKVVTPQKKVLIDVIENKEDETIEMLEGTPLTSDTTRNRVLIEEIDSFNTTVETAPQKKVLIEIIEKKVEETNVTLEGQSLVPEMSQSKILIEEINWPNNSTEIEAPEKKVLTEVIEDNKRDKNVKLSPDISEEDSIPPPLEDIETDKLPEALQDTTEIEKGTLDDLIKEKDTKYDSYLKKAEEEIIPNIAHFTFNLDKSENVNETKSLIEEIDNIIHEEASEINQMESDVKREIDNIITTAINTIEKNSPLDERKAMAILDHGIQMVDMLNNIGKLPIIPLDETNTVNTNFDENSLSEISNAELPTDEIDVALDKTFDDSKETNMADSTFQSCTNDDNTSNITTNQLMSSKTDDDSDNYLSFDNDDEEFNEFVATQFEKNIISSLELQVSNTNEDVQE